jgi:hypothetical protein
MSTVTTGDRQVSDYDLLVQFKKAASDREQNLTFQRILERIRKPLEIESHNLACKMGCLDDLEDIRNDLRLAFWKGLNWFDPDRVVAEKFYFSFIFRLKLRDIQRQFYKRTETWAKQNQALWNLYITAEKRRQEATASQAESDYRLRQMLTMHLDHESFTAEHRGWIEDLLSGKNNTHTLGRRSFPEKYLRFKEYWKKCLLEFVDTTN